MDDSVPFLEMMSEPVPLFAQETRLGAWASSLISLAISSSWSLLLSMKMRKSMMATSPTMDPRVAAAITPELEEVKTSRLTEQVSEPAVLLARHTYFPDMLLVRLLNLRVPCLSFCMGEKKTSDMGAFLVHL